MVNVGLKRKQGYFYFLDKNVNIARKKIGSKKGVNEVVQEIKIDREPGYFYYIDADGDVSRSKVTGRPKKKK